MKTFVGILIVLSFLESSIIPLDLVLICLICRSYLRVDKSNLFLAFSFGLLMGHLNLKPLGFESIVYLVSVQITQILSRSRLAGNSFLIIPLVFILLSISSFFLDDFNLNRIIIESILSLPILYIVRIWEERFIVRGDIKLRV